MDTSFEQKYNELTSHLRKLERVAIAFSGGVDSTFLVYAAQEALGKDVIAFTLNSPYIPQWEVDEASEWIQGIGVQHEVINVGIPENIRNNPSDRCYLCKKQIFSLLKEEIKKHDIPWLLEGTNKDDEGDYRPGMKALDELEVLSPLRAVGFTKAEIRQASKKFDLPTWNKPAYACLLTRIPYDTTITETELRRIEAGEKQLFALGFEGARLRSHDTLARIELQQHQFEKMIDEETRQLIVGKLKNVGYQFVCIDLLGYRMGSYNETISKNT